MWQKFEHGFMCSFCFSACRTKTTYTTTNLLKLPGYTYGKGYSADTLRSFLRGAFPIAVQGKSYRQTVTRPRSLIPFRRKVHAHCPWLSKRPPIEGADPCLTVSTAHNHPAPTRLIGATRWTRSSSSGST